MSRDLNSNLISQITSSDFRPFFAVEALFASSTLRLWTGLGPITISGNEYTGAGTLLSIGQLEETSEIAVRGLDFTLSGIPSDLLSLALSEPYQGRPLTLYFGITDLQTTFILKEDGGFVLLESGDNLLDEEDIGDGTPAQMFRGFLDTMTIQEGADTATISVTVENRLIDLERSRVLRYTDQSQKARFPDDKGFAFVEDLQDKTIQWGRK
tara:strand:- start:249 stop:881 length:633 start_codon:yes stop_codon:yes gene_type:complete